MSKMNEFNLTLNDLKEDKEYEVKHLKDGDINAQTIKVDSERATWSGGGRASKLFNCIFREVNKEAEFKEARCYKDVMGYYFNTERNRRSDVEQDYKIENNKLYVRDLC